MEMKSGSSSVLSVMAICVSVYASSAGAASVFPGLEAPGEMDTERSNLAVDIAESMETEGALDFNVSLKEEFSFGGAFGMQAFAFNVDPAMDMETMADGSGGSSVVLSSSPLEISNLPDGWSVKTDQHMAGYGEFDVQLSTTGDNLADELAFTLAGAGQEQIGDEFAAKVAGYLGQGLAEGATAGNGDGNGVEPPQAVPLPAAAWLFMSGVAGMFGVARRSSRSAQGTASAA